MDAFAYTTDHFCMSMAYAPLLSTTVWKHTLLMDLSSFAATRVSTAQKLRVLIIASEHFGGNKKRRSTFPGTLEKDIVTIVKMYQIRYLRRINFLIDHIFVFKGTSPCKRGNKVLFARTQKRSRNRYHPSSMLEFCLSPRGINRFLIILNSHQIELAGVMSSAMHGVINEIMGINFD